MAARTGLEPVHRLRGFLLYGRHFTPPLLFACGRLRFSLPFLKVQLTNSLLLSFRGLRHCLCQAISSKLQTQTKLETFMSKNSEKEALLRFFTRGLLKRTYRQGLTSSATSPKKCAVGARISVIINMAI